MMAHPYRGYLMSHLIFLILENGEIFFQLDIFHFFLFLIISSLMFFILFKVLLDYKTFIASIHGGFIHRNLFLFCSDHFYTLFLF